MIKKEHLYYPEKKLINTKLQKQSWSKWGGGGKKKIKDVEEAFNSVKGVLEKSFIITNRKFRQRYFGKFENRAVYNIEPAVFLYLETFKSDGKISNSTFTDFGMEVVSFDSTTLVYTVRLTIKNYRLFLNNYKKFLDTSKESSLTPILRRLKLFSNIDLLEGDNIFNNYQSYLEDNAKITIKFFINQKFDISYYKNVLINILETEDIELHNEYISFKSSYLDENKLKSILNLFDGVKNVSSSNIKLKANSGEVVLTGEDFEINTKIIPTDIVCIVDSGIEINKYTKDFIDGDSSISLIGENPLEDLKKSKGGHGTNVSSIAIYGKQIHNKSEEIIPACKVCSLQVLGSSEYTRYDEDKIINGIQDVFNKSGGFIKLFNLSIETDELNSNSISSFAYKLDMLMHNHDLLCVVSVGNNLCDPNAYPFHWWRYGKGSTISSPSECINGLSVGSIGDTLGRGYISGYSRKDNFDYPLRVREGDKKSRRKPDIVMYGGYKRNGFRTIGPDGNIYEEAGTSFATPYITHLLILYKKGYPDVSMLSLKTLLMNNAHLPEEKEFYKQHGVEYKKIYGYGTIDDNEIETGGFLFSHDDKVTLLIESSFDYSKYNHQIYPFLTTVIKMPQLDTQPKDKVKVKVSITVAYNPIVNIDSVDLNSSYGDYNTCFMSAKIHGGKDKLLDGEEDSEDTKLTGLGGKPWTGAQGKDHFWNNLVTEVFVINKTEYNKLVRDDLGITIKSMLKGPEKIIEYYKANGQKFSIAITFEDLGSQMIMDDKNRLYNFMKNENDLETINEAKGKLKSKI